MLRPAHIFLFCLFTFCLGDIACYSWSKVQESHNAAHAEKIDLAVSLLGLTDLCLATEARYTRHPAISDHIVPFMDYPTAIEHFPTGSFWAPIKR